ncbi:MAG: SUMF1/EgtB/PvdO family nonheme iron enzyme [Bryobacteraceae bacterium]|nr:SUMF1/EgtB/PvdO family nonheme iron enzyme [Bryobacteraceae bacterium]
MAGPCLARLRAARLRAQTLFEFVQPEALYRRPIAERHRLVFYVGHLEAFDWNLIGRGQFKIPPFHEEFDRLFAFGIDPPPGQAPSDQPSDWPELARAEEYVAEVRERIDRLWDDVPSQLRHVAVEHRLMHVETLQYLLHRLPLESLRPPRESAATGACRPGGSPIPIDSGEAVLGQSDPQAFGWDNEFAPQRVFVPEFRVQPHKVTNGEWLKFMEATGAAPPHFWREREGAWLLRTLFEEIPLPLDWPAYVTHSQATAYAEWMGMRLPTEAEWHRAAELLPDDECPNTDFRRWDPEPAGYGHQLVGNGWEWTSTVFAPFDGFSPFPFYRGYSADFFDGAHYVLKGGSPATAGALTRRSFRNWFRPDYPYIYSGFRCVS